MSQVAFVSGGTGLLGSNLVRHLASEGFSIRALVRFEERDKIPIQFDRVPVEVIVGNLNDVAGFAGSLSGVDVVFHTAAFFREYYKGGSHRDLLYQTNVVGTRSLIEAAYRAGVRRFVHTSSIAVLNGPPGARIDETMLREEREADSYFRSKILADREIVQFLETHPDMWATMVLPGWMHGPGDAGPTPAGQSVVDFLRGRLPGVLPGAFPLVDARDVAAAMLLAARKGRRGERYLAAGIAMTAAEFVGRLAELSGRMAPSRKIPISALYAIGAVGEAWARLTRRPAMVGLAAIRLLDRRMEQLQFDHGKSQRELGLEFRPVDTTLRDAIEWFRAHGYLD